METTKNERTGWIGNPGKIPPDASPNFTACAMVIIKLISSRSINYLKSWFKKLQESADSEEEKQFANQLYLSQNLILIPINGINV